MLAGVEVHVDVGNRYAERKKGMRQVRRSSLLCLMALEFVGWRLVLGT